MYGLQKATQNRLVGIADNGAVLQLDLADHILWLFRPAGCFCEFSDFLGLRVLAWHLDQATGIELRVQFSIAAIDSGRIGNPRQSHHLTLIGFLVASRGVFGHLLPPVLRPIWLSRLRVRG